MSTQFSDHDTLERVKDPSAATRSAPRQPPAVDHARLAAQWLACEECIAALRVADPGRGRFSPLRETIEPDAPQHWTPTARRNQTIDQLCRDYRLLLAIHAERVIWRRPYSPRD